MENDEPRDVEDIRFVYEVIWWLLMRSPIEDQVCRCPQCLNRELSFAEEEPEGEWLYPSFRLGCNQCGWRGDVKGVIQAAMKRGNRRIVDPPKPKTQEIPVE
jgi:hypothetical protein